MTNDGKQKQSRLQAVLWDSIKRRNYFERRNYCKRRKILYESSVFIRDVTLVSLQKTSP